MSAPYLTDTATDLKIAQCCVNTIRTLSIDAVQQARSGHPGTPMALAPLIYTPWNRVMQFDSQDPIWPTRDRFVLSNGHAVRNSRHRILGASKEVPDIVAKPSVPLRTAAEALHSVTLKKQEEISHGNRSNSVHCRN
jgi:hypothetical protein